MTAKKCGPGGRHTAPALKAVSRRSSYPGVPGVQSRPVGCEAERRLIAAGWGNSLQLSRDAERLALFATDFADRLCGVTMVYLCHCGESGRTPTLADAQAVLESHAVLGYPDELFRIIVDSTLAPGDEIADLIRDVQRHSAERSEQLCRDLTRDTLRALTHTLECPRCKTCASGRRVNNRPVLSGRAIA